MNEKLDTRAHHFACLVGIDYAIAKLVTKRIPKKMRIPTKKGKIISGNQRVFEILMELWNLKGEGRNFHYSPDISSHEKLEYLKDFALEENVDQLSENKISELYTRHKIFDVVGYIFQEEINIKTLDKSELEALVGWLFSKALLPLTFTVEKE